MNYTIPKFNNLKNLALFFSFTIVLFGCSSSTPTRKPLKWHKEKNYRWAKVKPGNSGHTGFKLLSPSHTEIHFKNTVTYKEIAKNREYLNGSGVAAADINGDGLPDLYFCNLNGPNELYENLGNFKFRNITKEAGVALRGYHSTGAVFVDVNGDGRPDLLVSSLGQGNVLFINDGNGHFTLDKHSGLVGKKGSMTMTLADINGDGLPDLYIANYNNKILKDYTAKQLIAKHILKIEHTKHGNRYHLIPPYNKQYKLFLTKNGKLAGVAQNGEKDQLYINKGHGTFKLVKNLKKVFLTAKGKPLGLKKDWGLSAKFYDLNNDGLPDLYVCNDFYSPDRIWINQGNGTFKALKWSAIRNLSYSAMAAAIGDINNDGRPDIFVTEMLSPYHKRRLQQMESFDLMGYVNRNNIKYRPQYNRNSLYLQRKDGTYAEIADLSGVEATGWSWATKFMDVNLDGYQDIIVNTGYLRDILNMDTQEKMIHKGLSIYNNYVKFLKMAPPLALTDKIFMNNGNLTFTNKGKAWGFTKPDIAQGMALADLNNDGVLDLVSNRLNETAAIYKNMTTKPRIEVRLKGRAPNTEGIGAKIKLIGGSPHLQMREITAGGDYLSSSQPIAMFAADKPKAKYTLIVDWRDGYQTKIKDVRGNRIYEISEPDSGSVSLRKKKKKSVKPLFKDVSYLIGFHHHEDHFHDFNLQPTLPLKLSRLGPGVTWLDLNDKGHEDFFEASGKGGKMGAFENTGNGKFRPLKGSPFDKIAPGDQTAIIGWNTNKGTNLLVGNANYEEGKIHAPSVYQYRFRDGHLVKTDSLPGNLPTTGPLAAADYNHNGYVDLFVGGRFMPAHYPANASSMFFKNVGGKFVLDKVNTRVVKNIGLVTGAVFTDYNHDGWPDLLLSTAWGSLILLKNNHGVFQNVTKQVGLNKYKGWWNGVATGDFNNDGYPDIIATNIGTNSPFQLENNKPIRLYYGNFSGNGVIGMIEASANKNGNYVPDRRLYNYRSIPSISSQFSTNKQFANATLKSIFQNSLPLVPYKEINTLKTMVFINHGGKYFTAHPLPQVAQFTSSMDATVADFNNDGNEDIFLSQNFFDFPNQFPRLDAGRGLLLLGNGKGKFTPVPGSKSGIKIYGEQRGAAVADFNGDGKIDLAVAQNKGLTKLYLNQTPKTGLRIRLIGAPHNLSAIGASIRLIYKNGKKGPEQEIQAGSGYWSQNSSTQIMGTSGKVKSIEIRWPDGKKETVPAKQGQLNYVIKDPGK